MITWSAGREKNNVYVKSLFICSNSLESVYLFWHEFIWQNEWTYSFKFNQQFQLVNGKTFCTTKYPSFIITYYIFPVSTGHSRL